MLEFRNKGAEFVYRRVFEPIEKQFLSMSVDDEDYKSVKKIHATVQRTRTMLEKLRSTGDVYDLILNATQSNLEKNEIFSKYGFSTFEDIIDLYEEKFKDDLDRSTIDGFEVDQSYTLAEVLALSGIYSTQALGILPIKNENGSPVSLCIRGVIQDKKSKSFDNYQNYWVSEDSLIYSLIGDGSVNYVNNKLMLTGMYDVHLFEDVGTDDKVYRGIFNLVEFYEDTWQVKLQRVNYVKTKDLPLSKPCKSKGKGFRGPYSYRTNKRARGNSKTSERKENQGFRAEEKVKKYFVKRGFDAEFINTDQFTGFSDIKIKNSPLSLEVKNTSSNNEFYLSNTQIDLYKNDETLLCFYIFEDQAPYLSRPYKESPALRRSIRDLNKIYKIIDDGFNRVRISDIKIAMLEDIFIELINCNDLTNKELKEFLKVED